jgi:hypothetical protein
MSFRAMDFSRLESLFTEIGEGNKQPSRPVAWCDCKQLAKLNGMKIDRRGHPAGIFFETGVDDEHICNHCGYFAVISATKPSSDDY